MRVKIRLHNLLVRYFKSKVGVTIKILDFTDLPGPTFDIIVNNLMQVIETHNLEHKVLAYCADNANPNFEGVRRLGCAAHIVHNAIQTASDLLPIDVECLCNVYKNIRLL